MSDRQRSRKVVVLIFPWLLLGWLPSSQSFCPIRSPQFSDYQWPCRSTSKSEHRITKQQSSAVEGSTEEQPIRLNKVFKATHSRRQADALIANGRVTVNGRPVTQKGGQMVTPYVDQVALDGKLVEGWEALNGIRAECDLSDTSLPSSSFDTATFDYIKYFKPRGVTCTTDRRVHGNILDALERPPNNPTHKSFVPRHRVFPVGRLDKDTSGLILLTSDGRLPNAVLRQGQKRAKVYHVWVNHPLSDVHLKELRTGVVITTVAQRDRQSKPLTAATLPCGVQRSPRNPCAVRITLVEGRNRQIRKMMAALGYTVVRLHRVSFGGIGLSPLEQPGDWAHLTNDELQQLWWGRED